MSRITSLIKMQLTNNYSWNIISNSLNGIDANNYTYSAPNTKVYVMEEVIESVDYAIKLIDDVEKDVILDKTIIEEEQKKITGIVNIKSNEKQNNLIDKDDTSKEEISLNPTKPTQKQETGLSAILLKPNIEFTVGDEFIYHGITATYDNKDITKDTNLKLKFRVQDKEFDNYSDLIYHVSNLESGNYIINYIINYKEEKITLNQNVTIKELILKEEPEIEDNENNETLENEENSNSLNEDNSKPNNKDIPLE